MKYKRLLLEDACSIRFLSKYASLIVKDYYDPIIGVEQNRYMINLFQSEEALKKQLLEGYNIFINYINDKPIGYFSYIEKEEGIYLAKFYIEKKYRGLGYGSEILNYLKDIVKRLNKKYIELNVNKHNPTIKYYENRGFKLIRSEVNDIGHGYVMDDYVYRLYI